MTDQDANHLRNAITRDQVACRCGHLLAACADCRDWLSENALRIAFEFKWWHVQAVELQLPSVSVTWGVDAAEADDLAYFESRR